MKPSGPGHSGSPCQERREAKAPSPGRTIRSAERTIRRALGLSLLAIGAIAIATASSREGRRPASDRADPLLQLAVTHSYFVFSSHGDASDVQASRPLLESAIREGRTRGRKVALLRELGGIDVVDSSTGELVPDERLLERYTREPRSLEDKLERSRRDAAQAARDLLDGTAPVGDLNQGPFASFERALDGVIRDHREDLQTVLTEALSAENYLGHHRLNIKIHAAFDAFRCGDFELHEQRIRAVEEFTREHEDSRDHDVLLQVGAYVRDHPGVDVVSIRGLRHYGVARREIDLQDVARTQASGRRTTHLLYPDCPLPAVPFKYAVEIQGADGRIVWGTTFTSDGAREG